jgi:Short C-terminal domain
MALVRRRPLLRAAAIGGGAYMAGKRTPRTEPQTPDMIQQLTQLGELHARGVLTDEEFAQQKARILAR